MVEDLEVRRLGPENVDDFRIFMGRRPQRGWCWCAAWWVPTWDGWNRRSAEENRTLREGLLEQGEYDGYLLYDRSLVVGWCQVGPRDRLEKLCRTYACDPDPQCWAVTCFDIDPAWRGTGAAAYLLEHVLLDLHEVGVRKVQGFPRCGTRLPEGEAWTGPEGLYRSMGFEIERRESRGPVYGKIL